jgi:streptogramin lyase
MSSNAGPIGRKQMRHIEQGSEVGEYRIESLVRTGSGGSVYRAEQPELGRTVAMHVPALSHGSGSRARFLEDAQLLAGLDHPNLVPVYEIGETDHRPFATVRDAPGRRLDELLRDGPLAPDRAVKISDQVASALEALDAAGATLTELPTTSVIVARENGDEHVYLSPLEASVEAEPEAPMLRPRGDGDSERSSTALARLLTRMVTGEDANGPARDRLPAPLQLVVERALAPESAYPSPSAFVEAAREAVGPAEVPLPRARVPGWALVTGAGFLLAAAVVIAWLAAFRGKDDQASVRETAPNTLVGRLEATIPLQATPGSLSIGEGTVWVATAEGTVLRIDPRRNEVVGAPIRFMEAREGENVTVRAGEGAVWVLDGTGGILTRIDPETARVTGRLRIGGILNGATVGEGSVWITRAPPGAGFREVGELIQVDPRRFTRVGAPIRTGPAAFDVEVDDGTVWTMNGGDGTITRVDIRSRRTRTVRPGSQPVNASLHGGTLWTPDPFDGTVIPLDRRLLRPPEAVIRADHPVSTAATPDAVWVAAEISPGGPSRLYRIDPRSRSLVGRPVEVGADIGWISAGLGAVWVPSRAKRALLRIVPMSPPPAAHDAAAPTRPGSLVSGPLAPGSWRADKFAAPVVFSIDEPGWMSLAPARFGFELARFDEPRVGLAISSPRQFFTPEGRVHRLERAGQLVDALTTNPNVRIIDQDRLRLGGTRANRVTFRVRQHKGYPDFCTTPCVALFPLPEVTMTAEFAVKQRMSVLSMAEGRIVVVTETEPPRQRGFSQTGSLLDTLHFESVG